MKYIVKFKTIFSIILDIKLFEYNPYVFIGRYFFSILGFLNYSIKIIENGFSLSD